MPSRIAWWVKSRVASRFDTAANPTPIIGMCSHPEKKTFKSQTNVCGVSAGRSDRAVAQNLGQRVGKSSWLAELKNVSVGHGVSLLRWRSGGAKHPHDTPPYPFMPSPTFAHSSPSTCFGTFHLSDSSRPSANSPSSNPLTAARMRLK
jgi:hypothetical protein